VVSQGHARQQIASFLAKHGPIEDPGGRATAKLKAVVGYQSSPAAFSQMLSAMERSGEIERTTRGKRTFRIAISAGQEPAAFDGIVEDNGMAELDYEELASKLLLRAVEAISAGVRPSADGDSWARRRIERLERRNAELEQSMIRVKAEARALVEERDALKQQLEHTVGNLAVLTDRLEGRPSQDRLSKRLGNEERQLLNQLRSRG
jgi:hypothetical protein